MVCHILSGRPLFSDTYCLLSTDPFLPFESDPLRTQALDSSLWELLSHSTHYHAPVSTMCKVFSEAFTKPGYSMEDFLDHTYNTVCACLLLGDMMLICCSCLKQRLIERSSENLL